MMEKLEDIFASRPWNGTYWRGRNPLHWSIFIFGKSEPVPCSIILEQNILGIPLNMKVETDLALEVQEAEKYK